MRFLGRVRAELIQQKQLKLNKELLQEMVVRVLKNMARRQMRKRMLELTTPRDGPFINIIVVFMNLIS